MTDSAVAWNVFGSEKVMLATDFSAGIHKLKVTTDAPSDGILISGFASEAYLIGTVKVGGVHTLCVTTADSNAVVAVSGVAGEKTLFATLHVNGAHVLCVTTDSGVDSIAITGINGDFVRLATIQVNNVHKLVVAKDGDSAIAVSNFGMGSVAFATASTTTSYSLAVSGLIPPYIGPLDFRSGAVGAAGTIKLYSDYNGPALRARNPDSNIESDINFTTGGVLDSAQIATALGSSSSLAVVRLYIQDNSGNYYVQSASNKQPMLSQSGPSGQWAVVFDGADDAMKALLTLDKPYSFYSVVDPITFLATYGYMFDGGVDDTMAITQAGSSPNVYTGSFLGTGPVPFPLETWSVLTLVVQSGSSAIRRNKLTAVSGSASSSDLSGLSMGSRGGVGSVGTSSNIAIICICAFDVQDDTSAQNALIDALGSAAGVSV